MNRVACALFAMLAAPARAEDRVQLPAFPTPALASEDGRLAEISSVRLVREMHRAGLRGLDRLEASDADYVLLRRDSLETLTAWLDATCKALNFDLRNARTRGYDGTVFARLLDVATSLGSLQARHRSLAISIGVLVCHRAEAWGKLPADGAKDVYVVFATDRGIIVYDPPTQQWTSLSDFPNKEKILQIRF